MLSNRWDDYKEEKWLQVGGWLQMRQVITKRRGEYKENGLLQGGGVIVKRSGDYKEEG